MKYLNLNSLDPKKSKQELILGDIFFSENGVVTAKTLEDSLY